MIEYLLIIHDTPKTVTIFDTKEAREENTVVSIYGNNPTTYNIPEIKELNENGIVHFEGDPSVEWIDAIIDYGN